MQVSKFKSIRLRGISKNVSLGVIILSIVVSVLGYLICPDQTSKANDGAVELGKQLPGFEVNMLKVRKNFDVAPSGFWRTMIRGKENPFSIVPYTGYTLNDLELVVDVFGKDDYQKAYHLIDVVYAVSKEPLPGSDSFFKEDQGRLFFKNIRGEEVTISRGELIEQFKKNNLEARKYYLGSDRFGRDLLSRLIIGTRISVFIGLASVIISLFLGLILGTLSGYFGGMVDSLVLWIMSVVWSIPGIMLVIAISMALNSKGIWVTFIAVGFTTWVEAARIIRGEVKSLKEKQFVEAARAFGLKDFRIVFRHIVPNIYGSIVVIATANYAVAILLEAGLSFLGLSVQPPAPSWGVMVFEGYQVLGTKNSWHMILFPGMAIIIMVLSFNLLGIGLQKSSSPNQQTGNLRWK